MGEGLHLGVRGGGVETDGHGCSGRRDVRGRGEPPGLKLLCILNVFFSSYPVASPSLCNRTVQPFSPSLFPNHILNILKAGCIGLRASARPSASLHLGVFIIFPSQLIHEVCLKVKIDGKHCLCCHLQD